MSGAMPGTAAPRHSWLRDIAPSPVAAGFISVLVGFTGVVDHRLDRCDQCSARAIRRVFAVHGGDHRRDL